MLPWQLNQDTVLVLSNIQNYSRTAMVLTSLGSWKFVLDMDSLRFDPLRVRVLGPGRDNVRMSFRSTLV